MSDLVKRVAQALYDAADKQDCVLDYRAHGGEACFDGTFSLDKLARAAIEAIWKDQLLSDLREFVKGISEDTYTQGVPWRRAQTLLERIDAALKELP